MENENPLKLTAIQKKAVDDRVEKIFNDQVQLDRSRGSGYGYAEQHPKEYKKGIRNKIMEKGMPEIERITRKYQKMLSYVKEAIETNESTKRNPRVPDGSDRGR